MKIYYMNASVNSSFLGYCRENLLENYAETWHEHMIILNFFLSLRINVHKNRRVWFFYYLRGQWQNIQIDIVKSLYTTIWSSLDGSFSC